MDLISGLLVLFSASLAYKAPSIINKSIKASTNKEFERFLKKQDLLNKYKLGKIKCSISGETVTEENIAVIEFDKLHNKIVFVTQGNTHIAARAREEELKLVIE